LGHLKLPRTCLTIQAPIPCGEMERVSNLTFLQLPVFHLLHFEFNGTDINADVSSSSFRFQVSDYFSDGGNRSGFMSRSGLSPFIPRVRSLTSTGALDIFEK
jgi:hypothetical protein